MKCFSYLAHVPWLTLAFRDYRYQTVYQGTNHTYKVNRLQELTLYRFRIAASNDAGQGEFSETYEFSTCIAPPASIKGMVWQL